MIPRFGQELGVVAEGDLDALSGSARALGGVDFGGQPERDAGVAQVVGALRQLKGVLVEGESGLTRSPSGNAARRGIDVVPRCVAEETSVGCHSKGSYVLAQHADEHWWDRNRSRRLGCSPLQARVALQPVQCGLPLLPGIRVPGILVEGPRVQRASQYARRPVRGPWLNEGRSDSRQGVCKGAARISWGSVPPLLDVLPGRTYQVVRCFKARISEAGRPDWVSKGSPSRAAVISLARRLSVSPLVRKDSDFSRPLTVQRTSNPLRRSGRSRISQNRTL